MGGHAVWLQSVSLNVYLVVGALEGVVLPKVTML